MHSETIRATFSSVLHSVLLCLWQEKKDADLESCSKPCFVKRNKKYLLVTKHGKTRLIGLIPESESIAVRFLSVLNVDLAELHNRILQQIDKLTSGLIEGVVITSKRVEQNFEPIVVDDAGIEVTVVITSKRVEQNLNRLTTILAEAKVLIQAIEELIQGRTSASSEDIDNVIYQLPSSNQDNQPGIKELLIELKSVIDADLSLTIDDQIELYR
ncbi:hypothetical protein [Nostoc sp.]|uniref:hypothetical protein n=1 Tax=Nostoc sp. TaxID=1180 RepID=UPI002FF5A452